MIGRSRGSLIGGGIAFILAVGVLIWANFLPRPSVMLQMPGSWKDMASLTQRGGVRIWVIDVGEPRSMTMYDAPVVTLAHPVTFPANVLRLDDRFTCGPDMRPTVPAPRLVDGVDERGISNNKFEELSVHTNLDGSVMVTCFAPGGQPEGSPRFIRPLVELARSASRLAGMDRAARRMLIPIDRRRHRGPDSGRGSNAGSFRQPGSRDYWPNSRST